MFESISWSQYFVFISVAVACYYMLLIFVLWRKGMGVAGRTVLPAVRKNERLWARLAELAAISKSQSLEQAQQVAMIRQQVAGLPEEERKEAATVIRRLFPQLSDAELTSIFS